MLRCSTQHEGAETQEHPSLLAFNLGLAGLNSQTRSHRWWNDPRIRAIALQLLLVAGVLALGWYLLGNTLHNLESRGITTGFGFLDDQAGFGIIQSLVDYSETSSYGRTFVVGLLNTLLVSALGILLATLLGFVIGVARLSRNWLIARLAAAYIEVFRNIPLLLQIFFWYFAVLRALPGPRQSLDLGGAVYLNLLDDDEKRAFAELAEKMIEADERA